MSTTVLSPLGVIRAMRVRYLLLIDLILIWISISAAVLLRLESTQDAWIYIEKGGWVLFVLAPLVRLPLYYGLNLYNRLWRYAGMEDLRSILYAGSIAPLLIGYFNFAVLPRMAFPNSPSRSVWLLEAMGSLALLTASRVVLRMMQQRPTRMEVAAKKSGQPTVIVGAGDAGAMILREILRNANLGYSVVAFVDDDKNKHGSVLFGVPVLGSRYLIPELVRQRGVQQVIIAMPTAPGKVIREVVKMCEEVQIQPQCVPCLHALVHHYSGVTQLRPVEIEDLLRREPIETDIEGVRKLLKNQRVLVTGGGGSIGRELCRQILQFEPAELIILGHGENSVFEIEQELRHGLLSSHQRTELIPCIADIRMPERIMAVFREHQPNIVFHAAAHKHVPLMETNPSEAVTNNILGTQNLVRAALDVDVDRFVMISTDKAVNPTSVMGACKRVAEFIVLDAAKRSGKPYAAVRFGNVLGSRGSVVLTFKQQIAAGGPVTVTDPDVNRFFMTISEAVQLLLQAAVLEHGSEIFMLDMGEPVRIVDLAHDLIRLSGLEVGRDIDIEFTGMRPGEKMYEDLFLKGEEYHTTSHPKIRIASSAGRFVPSDLMQKLAALAQTAQASGPEEIRELLCQLVPEYQLGNEGAPTLQTPPVRVESPQRPEKAGVYAQNGKVPPVPIPVTRFAHSSAAPN